MPKVYLVGQDHTHRVGSHRLYITHPIAGPLAVQFLDGKADVDQHVADYLIDQGHARIELVESYGLRQAGQAAVVEVDPETGEKFEKEPAKPDAITVAASAPPAPPAPVVIETAASKKGG